MLHAQPMPSTSNLEMNITMKPLFHLSDGSLFSQRYTVSHRLGQGCFGSVYAGTRNHDSFPVAIKVIEQYSGKMDPFNSSLPLEVSLLYRVSHIQGVIKLLDACWMGTTLIIVMERIESCMDLAQLMEKQAMTPELMQSCFRQLVETVIECHAAGVVHRDIKLENILVDLSSNAIKLIDFGCGDYYTEYYETPSGTPAYKPPEAFFTYKCNSTASEVWSLGILLYVMVTGRYLFETVPELEKVLSEGFTIPQEVPMHCQDLMRHLLRFDWNERPSLEQVLSHPFMIHPLHTSNSQLFQSYPTVSHMSPCHPLFNHCMVPCQ